MEWLILLALLVFVVLALLAKRKGGGDEISYEKNEPLFSPAERSFYGVLIQAVKDHTVVFGKVRVADVLRPSKGMGRSNWQKALKQLGLGDHCNSGDSLLNSRGGGNRGQTTI